MIDGAADRGFKTRTVKAAARRFHFLMFQLTDDGFLIVPEAPD